MDALLFKRLDGCWQEGFTFNDECDVRLDGLCAVEKCTCNKRPTKRESVQLECAVIKTRNAVSESFERGADAIADGGCFTGIGGYEKNTHGKPLNGIGRRRAVAVTETFMGFWLKNGFLSIMESSSWVTPKV